VPVRRQGQLRPARRAAALQGPRAAAFDIVAVNLDQKQPGFPADVLPRYLTARGVAFRVAEQDTYSVVKRVIPEGATMCSLCSRLRRGVLYRVAGEIGATKIALGHHRDDLMATFFLNLFFGGKLKTMPPKLVSDDGRHVVIRPLAYVRERDLARYAEAMAFPAHPVHAVRLAREPAAQTRGTDAARVGTEIPRSHRVDLQRARERRAHASARSPAAGFGAVRRTARPTTDGDLAFDVDVALEAATEAMAAFEGAAAAPLIRLAPG
jgi:tRNA 2-thiocytidine biosynthesis protein TtcA